MTDDKKNHAKLTLPGGKTIILPIVEGTIGPKVLDISSLYKEAGVFTLIRLYIYWKLSIKDNLYRW